jgi:hypothetical protein
METEAITLAIDESNDLTFRIRLEGNVTSPAKVRLVCEGDGYSYMFNGYGTGEDEIVQFTIPKMNDRMTEGRHKARVEVLVEDRYFTPLSFDVDFKKSMSVVAESVKVEKVKKDDVRVSATPVQQPRPSQKTPVIKFERRPDDAPPPPGSLREEFEKKRNEVPVKTSEVDRTGMAQRIMEKLGRRRG